jgi:indolepyruvate ferredoxin oxidoreductase
LARRLEAAAGSDNVDLVPAQAIATTLLGDAIATNCFMLGYAFQRGLVPLGLESLERAIELNGAAVEMNKEAFVWGRRTAVDKSGVSQKVKMRRRGEPRSVDEIVDHRSTFLTAYQDAAYALRYKDFVTGVRAAEQRVAPGRTELTRAVALNLAKLMSYKDEYEVARLYSDPEFETSLKDQFDGNLRLTFHLAPPFLAKRDPATGEPLKRTFGPWVRHAFRFLTRLRSLRGTTFDVFGMTEERRAERRLIATYEQSIHRALLKLAVWNYDAAVEIARIPDMIRGFGHVKKHSMELAAAQQSELEAKFDASGPPETKAA